MIFGLINPPSCFTVVSGAWLRNCMCLCVCVCVCVCVFCRATSGLYSIGSLNACARVLVAVSSDQLIFGVEVRRAQSDRLIVCIEVR